MNNKTKKTEVFRCLLSVVFVMIMSSVHAQDILVTESGDAIKAWGVDVGSSKIYYREKADENAPIKTIDKKSVLMWKKADGTRIVMDQDQPQSGQESPSSVNSTRPAPAPDAADEEGNRQCIAAFNASGDIHSAEKSKSKFRGGVLALISIDSGTAIKDKNVEVSFASDCSLGKGSNVFAYGQGVSVTVKNLTDRTVQIQLGNTFFMRNGIAVPYNYASTTQQVGGQQQGSTSLSQNVVAIPPHSSFKIGTQLYVPEDATSIYGGEFSTYRAGDNLYSLVWECGKSQYVNYGGERDFTPETSPLNFGFNLTYNFVNENTEPYQLNSRLYVSRLIGVKLSAGIGWSTAPFQAGIPKLSGDYSRTLSLLVFQR